MEDNKKSNYQMEINDLIDCAITNAAIRRGLIEEEGCFAISDEEAAKVAGGLTSSTNVKALKTPEIIVAGFKPVRPPLCPPLIVGLIVQDYDNLLNS